MSDDIQSAETPTLYEWAGGLDALRQMIDAFYDRVERVDMFDRLFPGGVTEEHRAQVTEWWAEVFGGPTRYTDEFGGYNNMLNHHRNLRITEEQRATFVSTNEPCGRRRWPTSRSGVSVRVAGVPRMGNEACVRELTGGRRTI